MEGWGGQGACTTHDLGFQIIPALISKGTLSFDAAAHPWNAVLATRAGLAC